MTFIVKESSLLEENVITTIRIDQSFNFHVIVNVYCLFPFSIRLQIRSIFNFRYRFVKKQIVSVLYKSQNNALNPPTLTLNVFYLFFFIINTWRSKTNRKIISRGKKDPKKIRNNRIISNPKLGQHKPYQRLFRTLCLQKGQFMILC